MFNSIWRTLSKDLPGATFRDCVEKLLSLKTGSQSFVFQLGKTEMISHHAVLTALTMGTHRVSLQSARRGVAAGVHTFLRVEKDTGLVHMWAWYIPTWLNILKAFPGQESTLPEPSGPSDLWVELKKSEGKCYGYKKKCFSMLWRGWELFCPL